MTNDEKSQLRFIEDKLIDVMAVHGHTASPKLIERLRIIQNMLAGFRTADRAPTIIEMEHIIGE